MIRNFIVCLFSAVVSETFFAKKWVSFLEFSLVNPRLKFLTLFTNFFPAPFPVFVICVQSSRNIILWEISPSYAYAN